MRKIKLTYKTKKSMSKIHWTLRRKGYSFQKAWYKTKLIKGISWKFKKKHAYKDYDGDGVINRYDCQPKNYYKQDNDGESTYKNKHEMKSERSLLTPESLSFDEEDRDMYELENTTKLFNEKYADKTKAEKIRILKDEYDLRKKRSDYMKPNYERDDLMKSTGLITHSNSLKNPHNFDLIGRKEKIESKIASEQTKKQEDKLLRGIKETNLMRKRKPTSWEEDYNFFESVSKLKKQRNKSLLK